MIFDVSRRQLLTGAGGALVAAPLLAACGGSTAAPAASPGTGSVSGSITVYNAQHESLTQAWADGFSKASGVTVTMRQGSDTEMANQIVAEGTASPADVFLTENSPGMTMVADQGLFAPIASATLAQVPAGYRPSSGDWTGIAARSTAFVYNTGKPVASALPTTLEDLAKPEWKGRWAASPSGADFQAIVSALLALRGKDTTLAWLDAMKSNAAIYKGNSAVLKAVNAGEVESGVIYHYYYFGDQAKGGTNSGSVGVHYFGHQDPGAFVSLSGAGVLKSSKNQAAAQAFVAYLTSAAGQAVLRDGSSFEYPVASGVEANPALKPLAALDAPTLDPASLNGPDVITLMQQSGLL